MCNQSFYGQERDMNANTAICTISKPVVSPDFTAIKQRQQATWASGDFADLAATHQRQDLPPPAASRM